MNENTLKSDKKAEIRRNAVITVSGEELANVLNNFSIKASKYSIYSEILNRNGLLPPRQVDGVVEMPRLFYGDSKIVEYLSVAAQPDRVITAVSTDYKKKLRLIPYKFFQSQKSAGDFTTVHHKNEHESEILFPYNPDEIITWLFLSMHYSVKNPFGVVEIEELNFNEVITVLGLLDCYKQSLAISLAERTDDPDFMFTMEQIKDAIANSVASRDRRWLLTSLMIFLEDLGDRIGSNTGGLTIEELTDEELNKALSKLEEKDIISLPESEELSNYILNPALRIMATSLFQWDNFVGLYDTQVLRYDSSGTEYGENFLAFFSSAAVNWVIKADKLSTDLYNAGSFKIQGLSAFDLVQILKVFFQTTNRPIENSFYTADQEISEKINRLASAKSEIQAEVEHKITEEPVKFKCPECGALLTPDHQFCSECGKQLETPSPKPKSLFCANCGYKMEAGSTFCDNCGEKLE